MNKTNKFLLLILLGLSLTITQFKQVKAQSNNIPSNLLEIVTKIDSAANNKDIELLAENISPEFVSSDGLNSESLQEYLEKMWSKYPDLKYTTSIESWEEKQGELSAVTLTKIEGSYESGGKKFVLNSEIKANQYFSNNQLIKQDIISEKTEITSGENPPKVRVNLPAKVNVGQEFDFDVILEEPVGSDIVLGGVSEEKVSPSLYLEPSSIELDALTAGGIFKRVKLPVTDNQDHWYSVILIRDGGIRMITQRVKVNE